jgi:5'-nucleotidase
LIAVLWALLGCQHPVAPPPASAEVQPGHLIVAHTNDLHAHFSPGRADWLDGTPDIGGFAAIGAKVQQLHDENGDDLVLYLDGGDILTGTPLMEFEVRGAKGGAMLDFMETAGVDAWVLGNHEFDIGYDHVSKIVRASKMPVLSANLDSPDGSGTPGILGLQDHTVFHRNGMKIGVFGLTTTSLARLIGSGATAQLAVRDAIEVAREQVAALEPDVDLVIALTHVGLEQDKKIAEAVPGIDLIVGGHSHTSLTEPIKVGQTWIVQAGSYARQLGVVDITVRDGRIVEFSGVLQDLHLEGMASHDPSHALEKMWTERLEAHFGTQIGQLTGGNIDRKGGAESLMGRWASDTVRLSADTDVGIYNPGGLRADLVEGPLTRGDVYNVFPFGNTIVRFDMTGDQLVGLLLRNASAALNDNHPVMQLSGVTVSWALRAGAPELMDIRVGGQPIDLDETYTVATNSYIAGQWSYNLGFQPENVVRTDKTVYQAAVGRVEAGAITPPIDFRMSEAK